jgi:hypothetical protein
MGFFIFLPPVGVATKLRIGHAEATPTYDFGAGKTNAGVQGLREAEAA